MSKKNQSYTAEFKAEAIKLIEANKGNVSETARQLGISMQTLSNWQVKAKSGTRDILNFICLKLIYKNDFYDNTKIKDHLEMLKLNKISMDELMKDISTHTIQSEI